MAKIINTKSFGRPFFFHLVFLFLFYDYIEYEVKTGCQACRPQVQDLHHRRDGSGKENNTD